MNYNYEIMEAVTQNYLNNIMKLVMLKY